MSKATVFLDRDGTLNVDKGYVHRIEDWEWIPGAIDAISALKKAGFLVVVVTNQAGIARGYYDEVAMIDLHTKVNEELNVHGAPIDGFYHCPHHPKFGEIRECECRKPMPGMIEPRWPPQTAPLMATQTAPGRTAKLSTLWSGWL